ncbi:glucose dehydrogenase [FAD, quinone]-like [Haematobia irritans]|uniref:glucose dehydrogenase [FAD, quinone]-like n=1 Tax=Haematobia irritans TaxID=7368 RepID=UPI003F4FF7E8
MDLLGGQCLAPSVGAVDSLVSTLIQTLAIAHCSLSSPAYWPPDYADEALYLGLGTFDFVIAGCGSAGSVVASRLSENPKWSVLVLEGGGDPAQESDVPLLLLSLQKTEFTYNYYTEPSEHSCKAFVNNRCYWPRGKGLGGSSQINHMLYLTGHRRDYDLWCDTGSEGWCYDDIKPYFQKSITPPDGNSSQSRGYLVVNQEETANDFILLLEEANLELGLPSFKNYGEDTYLGGGMVKTTVENGRRMSVAKAYLSKVSDRPNLKVIKNAQVSKVIFHEDGKRVKCVEFILRNTFLLRVNVGREAILSAGAIDTPKILMLSGVGPKPVLHKAGIPLIHDLPVGENLQDHVGIAMFMALDGEAKDDKEDLENIFQYLIYHKGPLSSLGSYVIFNQAHVNCSNPYPDIAIYATVIKRGDLNTMDIVVNTLGLKYSFKSHLKTIIPDQNIVLVYVTLLNPKSRGSLQMKSASPLHAPIINANYLEDPQDIDYLLQGIQYVEKLVETHALCQRNGNIIRFALPECDARPYKSCDYWKCYMKYFSTTLFHPTGTAKMGSLNDSTTVVSPRLLVKGVENLRVIDASIMPFVPSANTNGPTVMIAEKASDIIKEDWSYRC